MCGRYRRTSSEEELARNLKIPIPAQLDIPISWNIAPSQKVLAVRLRRETRDPVFDGLRWGLVPYWAKDAKVGYKTINARVETLETAPMFRGAYEKRRCLIPADGFYEWKTLVGGKIPYSVGLKDDSPFCFAGLWEAWKDPATGEWLRTCTIIVGEANELVAQVHDRMPIILPPERYRPWLSGEVGKEILTPYPAEQMKMYPVSPRVNSPKNDDATLIEPWR